MNAHLDVLEERIMEMIKEAHQGLEHANNVWPENSNVKEAKKNFTKVIQRGTQALISLGKARAKC